MKVRIPIPQLETRRCKCPCKRPFKCLPSSDAEFFSWYECGGNQTNGGRLEFTGTTSTAVKEARKREAKRRAGTMNQRNYSRWDKKPGRKA